MNRRTSDVALASVTCHAPDPHPNGRRPACGAVLEYAGSDTGRLRLVGVHRQKVEAESVSDDHRVLRCSRRSCGWWNVFRVEAPDQ